MKRFNTIILVLILAGLPLVLSGCLESYQTWTINADGSCHIQDVSVYNRIKIISYLNQMGAGEQSPPDEQDSSADDSQPAPEQELPSEEQILEEKIATLFSDENEYFKTTAQAKLARDTVRITRTSVFEDVEALFQAATQLGNGYIMAMDAKGEDQIEFSLSQPGPGYGDYMAAKISHSLGQQPVKGRVKFVLPGEIVSSDLGEHEGNSTWINVDSGDSQTTDAFITLFGKETISITCKKGELAFDLPLKSRNPYERETEEEVAELELPEADASPGYLAQAACLQINQSISLADTPEPESQSMMYGRENSNGIKIYGTLYVPEDCSLLQVDQVKALTATDDKGRSVSIPEAGDDDYAYYNQGMSFQARPNNQKHDFELSLDLPQTDDRAIEQVRCQASVSLCSGWKEHKAQSSGSGPDGIVDLSDILPGASLKIGTVDKQGSANGLSLEISGPPEVKLICMKNKASHGSLRLQGFSEQTAIESGEVLRRIRLGIPLQDDETITASDLPFTLIYPINPRKETVHFELEALDLM